MPARPHQEISSAGAVPAGAGEASQAEVVEAEAVEAVEGANVGGPADAVADADVGRRSASEAYSDRHSEDTEESLRKLTVDQLKQLLRDRGLPVGGKKAVLIARLTEAFALEGVSTSGPSTLSIE